MYGGACQLPVPAVFLKVWDSGVLGVTGLKRPGTLYPWRKSKHECPLAKVKIKVKVALKLATKARRRCRECRSTLSLTSVLYVMCVDGQRHASAALPPGKRHDTHCTAGWVGPQGRSGLVRKISPPPEFLFCILLHSFCTSSVFVALSWTSCILSFVFSLNTITYISGGIRSRNPS
jgi:hypothetical protein